MVASIIVGLPPDPALAELHAAVAREIARNNSVAAFVRSAQEITWHGYTDGSAHPDNQSAGVGGYLVSPSGTITGEFAEPRRTGESELAEWMAIQRLLERARDAGIRRLVVHTDNQGIAVVCEAGFRKKHRDKFKSDIAQWRTSFDFLHFAWIPRKKNMLADWLSRYSYKHQGHKICQPVMQTVTDEWHCASAMPLVTPAVPIKPTIRPNSTDVKVTAPQQTSVLEQPWCRKLVEFMRRHDYQIPEEFEIDPWMLEAAAVAEQRKKAKMLASATGRPYEQLLEQILHEAAEAEPFKAWLSERMQWRANLLSGVSVQPVPVPVIKDRRYLAGRDPIAFAQQLRAERAKSIHVEFYSEGLFFATSSDGHTQYKVDTIRGTCTCPDYYERGHYLRCKHLIAALNLEAELEGQKGDAEAA